MVKGSNERFQVQAASLPARVYGSSRSTHLRPAPLVLHLHGGAFVAGSPEAGRVVATLLADAGAVVFSGHYPLAPSHRFPHALEAAFGALNWLYETRAQWASRKSVIVVAGEEAGGNLAAALALMARDQQTPPLAGQVLLSPMLDPCLGTCSFRQAEAGSAARKWADGWHQYLGSADKAAHPYAAPLGSSRLAGLAPALVLTAEDDPMRDESLSYAQRLRQAGVDVHEHVLAGPTGWPCALAEVERAGQAWAATVRNRFVEFFAQLQLLLRPAASIQTTHMQER